MKTPLVSVCIPTYNGEKYIGEAIASVLAQTFTDFELIVMDDCSSDGTGDIARSVTDSRVRYLRNEANLGMVYNWNRCLAAATGTYIKVLCHDDKLAPDCIARCVDALETNEEAALVFHSTEIIDGTGRLIHKRRPFHGDMMFNGVRFARMAFRKRNLYGEPSNVLFRRSVSLEAGVFDVTLYYAVDWEYWIRLSLLGSTLFLDRYLASFRISGMSETGKLMKQLPRIRQDDALFIKKCRSLETLSLTRFDVFLHRVNIFIRTAARLAFLIFKRTDKTGDV